MMFLIAASRAMRLRRSSTAAHFAGDLLFSVLPLVSLQLFHSVLQ
jgi:hypothetical protein